MKNFFYIVLLFTALSLAPITSLSNNFGKKIDSLESLLKISKNKSDSLKIYSKLSDITVTEKSEKSLYYSHLYYFLAKDLKSQSDIADATFNLGRSHNNYQNYDSAIYYLNQSLKLMLALDRNEDVSEIYNLLGIIYYNRSDFSEALSNYQKSLEIRKELGNEKLLAQLYNNIALVYENINDYEKALQYHQKSIELKEKLKDKKGISASYLNISRIHTVINNLSLAKEYLLKSLKIKNEINDESGKALVYNNLGKIYELEKKYDTSLYYYQISLEIKKKLKDKKSLANTLNNIGSIFWAQNLYDASLDYHNQALSIYEIIKDNLGIAQSLHNISKVYNSLNKLDKALLFANSALKIAEEENFLLLKTDIYNLLSEVYAKKKNYKEAYRFSKLFSEYKDSIQALEKSRHIADMEVKYKTKAIERENELLLKDKERTKNLIILLVIISLLAMFIIFYIFISYKMKSKINAELMETKISLEESNKTKDKFFSIIAHDLKNPLSAFKNTIYILNENFDVLSNEEKKEMLAEMQISAERLLQLLENLLHWSRSQTGKIQVNYENFDLHYLVNNVISTSNLQAQEKEITLENQVPINTFIYSDPNLLLTVIRNIVSNSIKFTEKGGNIRIEIDSQTDDKILIKISDNGIGMTEEVLKNIFNLNKSVSTAGTCNEKGTGLGLILCKEFTEKLGGKLWVESKPNEGTIVFIELPIQK